MMRRPTHVLRAGYTEQGMRISCQRLVTEACSYEDPCGQVAWRWLARDPQGLRQNAGSFQARLWAGGRLLRRCRELPGDLGEHLEILAKARRVGARGAARAHTLVELQQFALEGLLIGGREPGHLQLLAVHALDIDERRRISQVRRWEADQHAAVGSVETERLPIVFDIRKHGPGVDSAHVVRVGESRREARPSRPETGGDDAFRLSDCATKGVDVVDRADDEQKI